MFATSLRAPAESSDDPELLEDSRFRQLLTSKDWANLPADVRRRFSTKLQQGARVYSGTVTACRISWPGWLLAQLLRSIGAPLPIADTSGLPTVVAVAEDKESGGQNWTRIFTRRKGFPQVIHSIKSFSGLTGLEEYIGAGIRMALTLSVIDAVLTFRSAGYFVSFGGLRFRIPRWLEPGETVVTHADLGNGAFLFTLKLSHPLIGTLIHQEALYRETKPCSVASY
jgi:hypothetical protein